MGDSCTKEPVVLRYAYMEVLNSTLLTEHTALTCDTRGQEMTTTCLCFKDIVDGFLRHISNILPTLFFTNLADD